MDCDIHVVGWRERVSPLLEQQQNVTIHALPRSRWPFRRGQYRLRRIPIIKKFLFPDMPSYLAQLIDKLQPGCVHSLGWPSAYRLLYAYKMLGGKLPGKWIYSCWGSDIYPHLLSNSERIGEIQETLQIVDFFIAGCQRDIALARQLGFRGEAFQFPGPGAYPIDQMTSFREPGAVSKRRVIALKGYQCDGAGQALTTLEAVRIAADALRNFRIIIHSAMGTWASKRFPEVKAFAEKIGRSKGLSIEFMPFSPVQEIWALFGRSRISIGISASDGAPNAMLESMVMGAFPIQSDTSAASEWIKHGVNGLLVPYDDPEEIANALRLAVTEDHLIDQAAKLNAQITRARLDISVIMAQILSLYERACRQ